MKLTVYGNKNVYEIEVSNEFRVIKESENYYYKLTENDHWSQYYVDLLDNALFELFVQEVERQTKISFTDIVVIEDDQGFRYWES